MNITVGSAQTEICTIREYLQYMAGVKRSMALQLKSTEEFLLEHGREWTPAALPPSVRPGIPQHCYLNAFNLAKRNPRLTYVEGVACSILPVPHAWCVDEGGNVIDNTWDNPDACKYFGVPFRTDFLVGFMRRSKLMSVLDRWDREWPLQRGVYPKAAWFKEME